MKNKQLTNHSAQPNELKLDWVGGELSKWWENNGHYVATVVCLIATDCNAPAYAKNGLIISE